MISSPPHAVGSLQQCSHCTAPVKWSLSDNKLTYGVVLSCLMLADGTYKYFVAWTCGRFHWHTEYYIEVLCSSCTAAVIA